MLCKRLHNTTNLGASKPEEYGHYFAWGEVDTKQVYTPKNCPTYDRDSLWLKSEGYIRDNGNLAFAHDAASQNWGKDWRMPTSRDLYELMVHTTSKWTTFKGVSGRILKSRTNGKGIFLPAQGNMYDKELCSNGKHGYYWSSTIDKSNTGLTYYFYFTSSGVDMFSITRDNGFAVRAVSD